MSKHSQNRPTGQRAPAKLSSGEMELMSLLWEHGPLTISAAHQFLSQIGYTTVQTRLNRLVDKGLAHRSATRPARYEAAVTADAVGANHLEQLVERVAGGTVVPLVAHLVDDRRLSRDEVLQLKRIIDDAERRLEAGDDSATEGD